MFTDSLGVLVSESFWESFYKKRKENILTTFSISHKSGVKPFLK